MERTLNITNGDSSVDIMKKANIEGAFLPWRDLLHQGPVPDGLSLTALSEVRARFISECGWGAPEEISNSFIKRDNELQRSEQYERVLLWFEHDLYDQLQILQILDWFNTHPTPNTRLSIICTDRYLGLLSPDEMAALIGFETPVTHHHLTLASLAWSAFRSNTPDRWRALLDIDTSILPFLKGAVTRMLEEYPSTTNGLSRTARQALKLIAEGEDNPIQLFSGSQALEERMFLGDTSFWQILNRFLGSTPPLLTHAKGSPLIHPITPDQRLTITQTGREVLAGKQTWLNIAPLNQWIGGVHLTAARHWCWDSVSNTLVASSDRRRESP